MKILMLAAAALLLGGCATYPGYQYSDGYYRGQTVYDNGYPAAGYASGYDAYGWPNRSAFYGGYGYGGYGYGGYGYGTTVIYTRDRDRHSRRRGGHWEGDRRHEHRHEDHRHHWNPGHSSSYNHVPVRRPSRPVQPRHRAPERQPSRGHTDRRGRHVRQH